MPLHEAVRYVAAAYVVVVVVVGLWIAIMGRRVARLERDLTELRRH